MASLILGTVGGMLFGPWGAMVGSTLGTFLFAPDGPQTFGPRLDDLKVTSSSRGAPIPKVYGSDRISGNVTWSAGLVETVHTEEVGGKGPEPATHTTYTYSCSFAIGLCEGPIIGIGKIWANGNLIYNNTSTATEDEISVSGELPAVFYLGSETQSVDPTIEADKGVGNVSAHRGQVYVVFENLQLADYGNRIPNLTFEVVESGNIVSGKIVTVEIDIADILENICVNSNLLVTDISTSILTDTIRGYVRSKRMTGRGAIEPLMQTYGIYANESDYKISFKKYEGTPDETIASNELAAIEGKGDPDDIVSVRGDDLELPRRIQVKYKNADDDYQVNVQQAQRIIT